MDELEVKCMCWSPVEKQADIMVVVFRGGVLVMAEVVEKNRRN